MGFNGRDRRRRAITLPPAQTRGIMSTATADCFRETPTQTHRSAPIREGERLRESERERERERKDRKTERERERESEKERQPARPWVHKVVLESYVEGSTGRNDGEKEQNLASFRHTLDRSQRHATHAEPSIIRSQPLSDGNSHSLAVGPKYPTQPAYPKPWVGISLLYEVDTNIWQLQDQGFSIRFLH